MNFRILNYKLILTYCIYLSFINLGKAQDAYFSQFYSAPLFMSPSLAGSAGGTRLIANYRNQWPGIDNGFQTYAFSADFYLDEYRSGIGAILVSDRQGAANLTNTYAGLQYSYRVQLGRKWQMVPALQFAYGQRSFDRNRLLFIDEIETGVPSSGQNLIIDSKISFFDFAGSVFFYSPNYWVGFSADHLLNPNTSFTGSQSTQSLKLVTFGGMNFWGKKTYGNLDSKSAAFCYRFEYQSGFKQLDLGAYWYTRYLDLGLWYRGVPVFKNTGAENHYWDNDALIFLVGISTGSFRIGYSYDLSMSHLAGTSAGAHEVSLMYEIGELFGYGKRYFECFSKRTGRNYKGIRFNKHRPRKMEIN